MYKKWTEEEMALVTEYYCSGHTSAETGEKFGRSKYSIENFVKRNGLSNGRVFGDLGVVNLSGLQAANESRHRSSVKRKAEETERKALDKRQKELEKQEKIRQAEELREQKASEKKRAKAEKADALFHLLNDKTHTCAVCGKAFSIADYMNDCGLKQIQHNPRYCSNVCKHKEYNRINKECKKRSGNFDRGNHRRRAKKHGVPYEPGITLKKVWKRDNGICQICGKPCDWSDRSWNEYCGPLYPSVDHIIALANGGGHVWNNVQLAHIICNSEKGATVDEAS